MQESVNVFNDKLFYTKTASENFLNNICLIKRHVLGDKKWNI